MFIDPLYIVLVVPAILFSMIAQGMVKSSFSKYSKQITERRITGAEAARRVLDANGLNRIQIYKVAGNLTDHYDDSAKVIRLSESVHDSYSTAAIGVATHECGHAIQYSRGFFPARLRTAIIPAAQIGSKLSFPLIIGGLFLAMLSNELLFVSYIGLFMFMAVAAFEIVTLPTEFDASRRALVSIREMDLLNESEYKGAKKVLTAAALTYVAALAVTLMQILRFYLIIRGRED